MFLMDPTTALVTFLIGKNKNLPLKIRTSSWASTGIRIYNIYYWCYSNSKQLFCYFRVVFLLYVYIKSRHLNTNWGSSMQSQYFITALKSVQSLTKIEDHVKNYRPKLIIFCGDPSHRPSLGKKSNLLIGNNDYSSELNFKRFWLEIEIKYPNKCFKLCPFSV